MAGLDIAEPQVLIHAPDHADGDWLHAVLLRRVEQSKWICLLPDRTIERRDLSAAPLHMVARLAAFPDSVVDYTVRFSTPPTDVELGVYHARASQMAMVLGGEHTVPPAAAAGSSWRICHTGAARLGDAVDDELVQNGQCIRGAMGLAQVDGEWWPVERVLDAEYAAWRTYMLHGPHRDQRIAGDVRDAAGRSFVSLHDYLGLLRPVDRSKEPDYPHPGPSAATEVLQGVRGSGRELLPYDEMWAAPSGIHAESAIRKEHKTLFTARQLFQSWDQIDLPATAGGEFLCRRAIQIQRAVRSNPKAPNFVGLEKMTTHALDGRGGLATMAFTQHFATVAEADARILKQNRLLRAELQSGFEPSLEVDDEDGLDEPAPAPKAHPRRKAKAKAKA